MGWGGMGWTGVQETSSQICRDTGSICADGLRWHDRRSVGSKEWRSKGVGSSQSVLGWHQKGTRREREGEGERKRERGLTPVACNSMPRSIETVQHWAARSWLNPPGWLWSYAISNHFPIHRRSNQHLFPIYFHLPLLIWKLWTLAITEIW